MLPPHRTDNKLIKISTGYNYYLLYTMGYGIRFEI